MMNLLQQSIISTNSLTPPKTIIFPTKKCLKKTSIPVSLSTTTEEEEQEEENSAMQKIGSRIKVTVPLKVYHVPKVAEIDLTGKQGKLAQYVNVWKGKRISANLPFKIEFYQEIQGKDKKFFAHLKEDEFEYLD